MCMLWVFHIRTTTLDDQAFRIRRLVCRVSCGEAVSLLARARRKSGLDTVHRAQDAPKLIRPRPARVRPTALEVACGEPDAGARSQDRADDRLEARCPCRPSLHLPAKKKPAIALLQVDPDADRGV